MIKNKNINKLNTASIVLGVLSLIATLGLFVIITIMQASYNQKTDIFWAPDPSFPNLMKYNPRANITLSVFSGLAVFSSAILTVVNFIFVCVYLSIYKRIHKDSNARPIYNYLVVSLIACLFAIAFYNVIFWVEYANYIYFGFFINLCEIIIVSLLLSIDRFVKTRDPATIYYLDYLNNQVSLFQDVAISSPKSIVREKVCLIDMDDELDDLFEEEQKEEMIQEPVIQEPVAQLQPNVEETNFVEVAEEPVIEELVVEETPKQNYIYVEEVIEEVEPENVDLNNTDEANATNEESTIVVEPSKEIDNEPSLKIKDDAKLLVSLDEEKQEEIEKETFEVVKEYEIDETKEQPNTIIISLAPAIVEEIVNEGKDILFCKKIPAHKVDRVIVYCIKPLGKVVGEFTLKSSNKLAITSAWKELSTRSTITKKQFNDYFENSKKAKYLEINGFINYKTYRPIENYGLTKGPAGFSYLRNK